MKRIAQKKKRVSKTGKQVVKDLGPKGRSIKGGAVDAGPAEFTPRKTR